MKGLIIWFAGLALASIANADFLPPNDLHLQDSLTNSGGLSEAQYQEILNRLETVYGPIVAQHGATLQMENKWADPLVNADAQKIGNVWTVRVYGGLARRAEMNVDGITLVACHEIGHHVGGFPNFRKVNTEYSDEGQADYFATQACADLVWQDDLEENKKSRTTVNPEGKALCDAVYSDADEQNLCYRKAMASLTLGYFLNDMWPGASRPVSIGTPATIKVLWTNHYHAYPQCRLDTYVAGALCVKNFDPNVIPKDEAETGNYTCTHAEKIMGARPRCWFKPNSRR